jgi:hypothetical protein
MALMALFALIFLASHPYEGGARLCSLRKTRRGASPGLLVWGLEVLHIFGAASWPAEDILPGQINAQVKLCQPRTLVRGLEFLHIFGAASWQAENILPG